MVRELRNRGPSRFRYMNLLMLWSTCTWVTLARSHIPEALTPLPYPYQGDTIRNDLRPPGILVCARPRNLQLPSDALLRTVIMVPGPL
ncbi:hypothetical protein F5146DRAFT_1054337, partial [Armillaria mellea]